MRPKKVLSIVGARPQFIKAAPVSRALRKVGYQEFILHTGQHYDHGMSRIFFEELGIVEPDVNLGVGSGSHGWQTAQMLIGIENVLLKEKPGCVMVYGDTNSTLAGALAACKLHLPLAHVEAGLRSFNRQMPEEHNRVLTDHCSDLLFCPTQTAVDNLVKEGIIHGVHLVGDVMLDAALMFLENARHRSKILQELGLEVKSYFLVTIHRPSNTDVDENLRGILSALFELRDPVIFPVHPRTRSKLFELYGNSGLKGNHLNVRMIDPIGYLDMLLLEQNAKMILTDSGGIQKEAYFFGVPCVTLRTETEWVETVEAGWNCLVGADKKRIIQALETFKPHGKPEKFFGDGRASERIADVIGDI